MHLPKNKEPKAHKQQPGQKIEKVLEIKEGIVPRQIKIKFVTFGETVKEENVEFEKSAVSGAAIDIDVESNLIDFYAIIVPENVSEDFKEYYEEQTQKLSGAAISDFRNPNEFDYNLEIVLYKKVDGKKVTQFGDLYGPYVLKKEQVFVFGQQLIYNPKFYNGDYLIATKIYRGGSVIAENNFDVNLK